MRYDNRSKRMFDQIVEKVPDTDFTTGSHIENFHLVVWRRTVKNGGIGVDYVFDIGEISSRLQIAHFDHSSAEAFGRSDLRGERWQHETFILSCACVIKQSKRRNRQIRSRDVSQQHFRSSFGPAIW